MDPERERSRGGPRKGKSTTVRVQMVGWELKEGEMKKGVSMKSPTFQKGRRCS